MKWPAEIRHCLWLGLMSGLILALGTGCRNTYARLAHVADLDAHATLLEKSTRAGNHTVRIPVVASNGNTLNVAVHATDSQTGRRDRIFVLIHGVAADSHSWRFLRGGLTDAGVLAVDLPGCGESDAPDDAFFGPEGYSPTTLAECVLQAVRTQLPPSATPPHITLVGHSLGGAVILRMYGHDRLRTEYADVLSRVDSAVLLAPADIRIPQMPPNLRRACEISDVEVVLAQSLGMLPELAAQMEWNGVVNGPSAMVEEAQRDLRLFTDLPHLHAMQSMILHAVPQNHGILDSSAADYWERQYQYLTVPTLVVWGSLDSTLGPSMGYKLQAQLPDARLRILNPAKHCLMIEQPQACIDLIRSFTAGTLGTERIATIPVQPPVPHAHLAQR